MYACMHVCMYACMHVCMYACMHVCMYACMHVCMYACMHVCMHACMHACMYVCKHTLYICGLWLWFLSNISTDFGHLGWLKTTNGRGSLQNFSLRSAADCWAYRGPHGLPGRCRWRGRDTTVKRCYWSRVSWKMGSRKTTTKNEQNLGCFGFWILKFEPSSIRTPNFPSSTCLQPALPISHPRVPDRVVILNQIPQIMRTFTEFWDHQIKISNAQPMLIVGR